MYFRPPFAAGFTLTELLIAIAIIGILVTVVFSQVGKARDGALEARALVEFNQFENALEKYRLDTSTFPPDANRTLPPELDSYLDRSRWNKGPWANSIYD
jgi:general secretion pathway protein G